LAVGPAGDTVAVIVTVAAPRPFTAVMLAVEVDEEPPFIVRALGNAVTKKVATLAK